MGYLETWQEYTKKVNETPWLKAHRDWVEENKWGFGDRPLHWMWYELLQKLPDDALLVEIGVYKGQTLSLWRLISNKLKKNFSIWGISPMIATSDKYHQFEDIDYVWHINEIHATFELELPDLLEGYSTDMEIIEQVPGVDLLYIDGGHDLETVRQDVTNYVPKVKPGGFVVFDDASCNLDLPVKEGTDFWYKGLPDVSQVADEFAADHKEILTVGHNRVFTI